jgi:hypothetical protein
MDSSTVRSRTVGQAGGGCKCSPLGLGNKSGLQAVLLIAVQHTVRQGVGSTLYSRKVGKAGRCYACGKCEVVCWWRKALLCRLPAPCTRFPFPPRPPPSLATV